MMLAYHELSKEHVDDVYTLPISTFRVHAMTVGAQGGWRECITFDDGHASNYTLAPPILAAFNLRAIFFVTTAWTGVLESAMSWGQLRELSTLGHSIGSHTHTHPFLTSCSDSALREELSMSRQLIEQQLGTEVDTVSLPGGRVDARVLGACAEAGYHRVFTSLVGQYRPAADGMPEVIGRYVVTRSTTPLILREYLSGEPRIRRRLQFEARAKKLVRSILGDELYQKAWRRAFRSQA